MRGRGKHAQKVVNAQIAPTYKILSIETIQCAFSFGMIHWSVLRTRK